MSYRVVSDERSLEDCLAWIGPKQPRTGTAVLRRMRTTQRSAVANTQFIREITAQRRSISLHCRGLRRRDLDRQASATATASARLYAPAAVLAAIQRAETW